MSQAGLMVENLGGLRVLGPARLPDNAIVIYN